MAAQNGCLKKRRRRALAKVTGLSTIPYDENLDTYRGLDIYGSQDFQEFSPNLSSPKKKGDSFAITMSRLKSARARGSLSSSTRITRDPSFTINIDDDNPKDEYPDIPYESTDHVRIPNPPKTQEAMDRPVFVDYRVILTLRSWILLGISTFSFPWTWNKKTNRIDKWSPRLVTIWWIVYRIAIFQIIGLMGFQFYQFYEKVNEPHEKYREVFMSFMSMYWYITCLNFNFNLYKYRDETRQYINSLFEMNQKLCERYVVDLKDYPDGGRILINVSFPSNLCEPFAAAALFVVMPYQKWFLYHYIYKEENPWYYLLPGAFQEYVLVGQVITSYLLISWTTVAHTNSVDFWLKEIHKGSDSGYTIPETRNPKTAIEIYRTLQIICTLFNDCISPMGIMMVKFNVLFGIMSCGYVLIRSMNHLFIDEFPGILMYPISVLDCVTAAIAMLNMSAQMHDLGCGFIDSWSQTKQTDFRRILRALPTLRVKIGSFYYITVSTLITFFKTVMDGVIDCVMTFP